MHFCLISQLVFCIHIMNYICNGDRVLGLCFKTYNLAGKRWCKKMCFITADCRSINYNRYLLTCELNYANQTSNSSVSTSSDYEHITKNQIAEWIGNSTGGCRINTCQSQHTCIQLSSGAVVCVITSCPHNGPSVYYGFSAPLSSNIANNGSYTPEINVGQSRTYACAAGTVLMGNNSITCKADGNWGKPSCSCQECLQSVDPQGFQYRGTKNITENGRTCQKWSAQTPHAHIYTGSSLTENYCRNPGSGTVGNKPLCFTMTSVRWEYCNVPEC